MKQIVFLISAFLMLSQIHSIPILDTSTGESVPKSFSDVENTESASNDVVGDKETTGEPLNRWHDIRDNLLQLTELVENLMIIFKGDVENAWKGKNVELTANWETRTNEIKTRVEKIKEEILVFIQVLSSQEPIVWANIDDAINKLLVNLINVIENWTTIAVANASSTEEERTEIVDEAFQDIMATMNNSWATAQEIIINETKKRSD